ncbi:MAG: tetratricopeptide repeat protein [Gemmatimonadales bacterium]
MNDDAGVTTLDAGLKQAEALEQTGDVTAAAHAYETVLREHPDSPDALFRFGRVMARLGQHDMALVLVGQAAVRAPREAKYHRWMGELLLATGCPTDAAECFREALGLAPADADARLGLAEALLDQALVSEAASLAEGAPTDAMRSRRLAGRLALVAGRFSEAVEHLMAHLRSAPRDGQGLFYLGVALQAGDLLVPAAAAYRQAVACDPGLFEAHTNLSTALLALGEPGEALAAADAALELAPARPGILLNRANARRDLGDLAGAAEDYRAALDLDPEYAEGWSSLANLYHDQREWSLALDAHDRAVALAPAVPQVYWNRSFTRLATGDLGGGWADYEYRLTTKAARPEPRSLPWPVWRGESLEGRRILIHREQGLGDELLFATCVPDVADRAKAVTLLASPRLVPMLQRSLPSVRVLADEPDARIGDGFDFQVPLASLPRWLRRTRTDFEGHPPLLLPSPEDVERWRTRLQASGGGRFVGICWRSGLLTAERRRHYLPLDRWLPLLRTPGITWVNLQYDDCDDELAALEAEHGIRLLRFDDLDLRDDLDRVTDLVAALDAVVTAPTAVSSLAGAIGRPTWQLDVAGDWTALGEARSPWFPSIRLAAVGEPDGGAAAVQEVAEQLREVLAGEGRSGLKLSGGDAET